MNRELEPLVFLLTASALSEPQIRRALKAVQGAQTDAVVEMVRLLRNSVRSSLEGLDSPYVSDHVPNRVRHSSDEVASRASAILLEELRLPTGKAAKLIQESLEFSQEGRALQNMPPFRAKEGFKSWIKKLERRFSPSLILHHVTMIRNQITKSTSSDWPLRDRER